MGCIRQMIEQRERDCLSPRASLSSKTRGRERPMPPDDIRTEYQRDRDRIIHCKSFRRLMHKTQVFLSPEQDHYRTRLTHTLEVMQIGRTISRCARRWRLGMILGIRRSGMRARACCRNAMIPLLRIIDSRCALSIFWKTTAKG